MKYQVLALVLIVFSSQIVIAQVVPTLAVPDDLIDASKETSEISSELKKAAVEFLRNTAAEANNMRTIENRIGFSAEMAGLMWFNDETEARAMYQNVINNFRQILIQYDAELNSLGIDPGRIGRRGFGVSGISAVERKLNKALSVRQQITKSIAEHDSQLAFEFLIDTAQVISNPKTRKDIEMRDSFFETELLQKIAENNLNTAFKYGKENLRKGVNFGTINLLKKIYGKDVDKGIEFGESILAALRSGLSPDPEFGIVLQLLLLADETPAKKKNSTRPVFSDQQHRELAEILAQLILKTDEDYGFVGYLPSIEKFAPGRAAQVRAKFGIARTKDQSKSGGLTTSDIPKFEEDLSSPTAPPESDLEASLGKLNDKSISEADRAKIINRSREIIDSLGDRMEKVMALSGLAFQVSQLGNRAIAVQILDDAQRLLEFQPTTYKDYLETMVVAAAYAQVEPDKAFPLVEKSIYRINDTIAALIKVGEFIDAEGEIMEDGEVQLGSFGGGITKELLSGLGAADTTVKNLAIADFKRTKDLTNRFDRQEVRILAKMLVLRSVLGKDKASPIEPFEDMKP